MNDIPKSHKYTHITISHYQNIVAFAEDKNGTYILLANLTTKNYKLEKILSGHKIGNNLDPFLLKKLHHDDAVLFDWFDKKYYKGKLLSKINGSRPIKSLPEFWSIGQNGDLPLINLGQIKNTQKDQYVSPVLQKIYVKDMNKFYIISPKDIPADSSMKGALIAYFEKTPQIYVFDPLNHYYSQMDPKDLFFIDHLKEQKSIKSFSDPREVEIYIFSLNKKNLPLYFFRPLDIKLYQEIKIEQTTTQFDSLDKAPLISPDPSGL